MTTPTIHPIVLEKLQRFSRQRQRLIIWRGVCGTLAVWCATMMTVALIDRFVLIPDGLRWGLSLAGYIATGLMFWIECGRQLMHQPDTRELARLVELAAPQLREELLSAVELAEGAPHSHWDSDEFRAALQQATAHDVGTMQIERLLTRKLITGWIYAVVAVGTVLLVLLGIPGLRFRQSFARAVAPTANLARHSSVQITVIAPTPPDRIAPEGDSLPVTVAVSGADVQQVILEIFPHHGPRERTSMLLSAVNQFTAAIQLNQEPVQFRIHAQESLTRKYTLTPRPRPHVVKFQKIYHFPAYSQLPPKTVTEENGDLDALEGTTVELNLAVDQPIKEAALQLDTGAGKTTKSEVLLAQAGNSHLSARVPLTASGIYQVHIVAAQTGFANKYSPQYEIRVRPDLIPFAKIDKPEQDEVALPPDAVVNLAGRAKDDLALARVEQQFQVNHGAWQTFLLAQTTNSEIKVARVWDLFDLGVHPGDRVITKLVATDNKGQRGESAPLRIRIATAGFEPDRLNVLKERQALDKTIHDFRDAADQLDSKTRDACAIVNNPAADLLQKKQTLLAATAAAEMTDRKAAEVIRQIKDVLPRIKSDREAADLTLIGTAISRVQHEDVAAIKMRLGHANTDDSNATKTDLANFLDPLATGTALARAADDTHRHLLAAMEATAAVRDLQQLAAEQHTLSDQLRATATDAAQTERAAHRQAVIAVETKAIENQLKTLAEEAGGGAANTARNLEHALALNRENLEKALSAEPSVATLKPPAEQLQHSVDTAANTLRNTSRDLDQRAESTRKNLQDQTGTAADAVAKITTQPDSWQAAADQLKDRAALEERRPHADAPFIAAVGTTADAVQALHDVAGDNAVAAATAVGAALRKLEIGHAIDEQVSALHQLAAEERWEKPTTPAGAMDRANDWKAQQPQLQSLPQQLTRAQLPAEAKRALEAAVKSPAAQQINNEMTQRQAAPDAVNNVAEPLAKLADDLVQTKQQLQPALDQARAEIEKRAPALSDRLAGLAQVAEKLETATVAQAQQAAKPDNANQVRAAAQNLAAAQQHLDNRVADVKDALRRSANAQNLGTDEGRARARDADDAAALLRQPTPSADNLLTQAATTAQPEQQQRDLNAAAAQQTKLAEDLNLLAEHSKNTAAGQPEATRAVLREAEKELGLKPTLDTEYTKAQALEKLAGLTPQEQLAELERALPNSQPMRRELSDIAKVALQSAAADLQKTADAERQIAQQPILDQAKRIAAEAQQLARQDVPAIAMKSVEIARPELNEAGQRLESAAQNMPRDFSQSPEQLVRELEDQAPPLQQAATALNNAATKLGQAAQTAQQKTDAAKADNASPAVVKQAETTQQQAQAAAQQAQHASHRAAQLAQQARQSATAVAEINPLPTAAQAKQIAAAALKLARQDLPALAQQTGAAVKPELNNARQKLDAVAQNIPQDFAQPPAQLVQQMQDQVAPLQQSATELNKAAAKLGQAAQAAQQKADAAAQAAQQAKANNAGESAVNQADAAQQQAHVAAQQALTAHQQAQQARQQAEQLTQQANQLATALNQATPQLQAVAQQPAIAQSVHTAGNDVARAGRHEDRLGQAEASKQLQRLGQQIENQTGAQVAQAAATMAHANSPAQVQAAAQAAHAAIQAPLNDLNTALLQAAPAPGNPAPPQETPSQLATAPAAAAKWLARALDSLDTTLNPTTAPASPATQAQPGQPAEAGQPIQNAATQAAKAAAQAQASSMRAARSQGLAPGEPPIAPGISAGGGLNGRAPGSETAAVPEVNPTGGNWGKLPPKLARDLIDSQREGVSGQYREMVDMYFRALADKAREKQP